MVFDMLSTVYTKGIIFIMWLVPKGHVLMLITLNRMLSVLLSCQSKTDTKKAVYRKSGNSFFSPDIATFN